MLARTAVSVTTALPSRRPWGRMVASNSSESSPAPAAAARPATRPRPMVNGMPPATGAAVCARSAAGPGDWSAASVNSTSARVMFRQTRSPRHPHPASAPRPSGPSCAHGHAYQGTVDRGARQPIAAQASKRTRRHRESPGSGTSTGVTSRAGGKTQQHRAPAGVAIPMVDQLACKAPSNNR